MINSSKLSELFSYCSQTLELMEKDMLPSRKGLSILKKIEPEFEDKKAIYPYLNHINEYKTNYWHGVLFKTDNEVLDYLRDITKRECRNDHLVKMLVERFFKMPVEVKSQFYETNFVVIAQDERTKLQYAKMSGKSYGSARIPTIFHNLPTTFLLSSGLHTDHDFWQKICKDVKKTLNLSENEFFDRYGTAIIYALDVSYINKHWTELQMDKRPDQQQAYITKHYHGNQFHSNNFLNKVQSGLLPYDLKLPRGERFVMNKVIAQELNHVSRCLDSQPFDVKEFHERTEYAKDFLGKMFNKHDLYFVNHKLLEETKEHLRKAFENRFRYQKDEIKKEVEKDMLDFMFSMDSLFQGKKETVVKKVKI